MWELRQGSGVAEALAVDETVTEGARVLVGQGVSVAPPCTGKGSAGVAVGRVLPASGVGSAAG